jgi:hypothetical protein
VTYIILMALIGSTWRIVDGHGVGPTHLRSAILLAILLTFMQFKVDMLVLGAWPMWLWAVSIVAALQRGFKDWNKFDVRQITQYYYAAVPLPILFYQGILTAPQCAVYALCLILAGLAHPVLVRTPLPHATRWAEGAVGALVLGGMSAAYLLA